MEHASDFVESKEKTRYMKTVILKSHLTMEKWKSAIYSVYIEG